MSVFLLSDVFKLTPKTTMLGYRRRWMYLQRRLLFHRARTLGDSEFDLNLRTIRIIPVTTPYLCGLIGNLSTSKNVLLVTKR